MVQPGILGEQTVLVDDSLTAKVFGSGTLEVYGTPAMIALIENTALKSLVPYLDEGWGSVGTSLNVQHLSATPVGMKVSAKTTLVEVDRRRLVFACEVYDEAGLIGKGTHERFLVEETKFQAKTNAKLNK